ncbi:MAG TPA: MBL fold metallo-hydrolase [Gaiellaceae bacterium]|jgi:phosphoribosyl 1,2-cyclic phosphodiesterase
MRLTIWGCRGSIPTPGPETVEHGGNTSCVEVSLPDGTLLVLDAGTGIRTLGHELAARRTKHVHLLLTHLHLDHIEGLRFFAPLWQEQVSVDIWGPPSTTKPLRDRIARSFSPPLFPIDLRDLPPRVAFHDVPRQPWRIGGATLTAALVAHPGPTVGYRIEAEGASVAYLPDHEPALVGAIRDRSRDWISGASIAQHADLLVHDAQYFAEEYGDRVGWGHSSVDDAAAYSSAVSAKRLVLFHHDPDHSDEALERLEARARALLGPNGAEPTLAREGMVLEVPAAYEGSS